MLKIIYSYLRKLFPSSFNKKLTSLLFQLRLKPRINKKCKSPFQKGIITFSADFEMAWAFRYSKSVKNALEMGLRERENFPKILRLFNKYNIPVTWATVGHLFLDHCKKNNGIAHSEMPRPAFFENQHWLYKEGDWYDHDPSTNYLEDPAWFAKDLIDKILDSPVKHEIGCHTFSHIDFSYENCPPELAEAELNECKKLADKKSINLKSMVFPGGTAGNYEVLKKEGFISYRKSMQYDVDLPYKDKYGLIAIPSSFALNGNPKFFTKQQYLNMATSFIDAAIRYNLVCHFWFHPSMDRWYLQNIMPLLLRTISKYRDSGNIKVMTMGELAEQILRNE